MTATDASTGAEPFYGSVLDQAELVSAMRIEGVDEELAMLRMRLRWFTDQHPEEHELMLKSVNLLVRAAGARYRMSAKSKEDLAETLSALVTQLTPQLFPDGDV